MLTLKNTGYSGLNHSALTVRSTQSGYYNDLGAKMPLPTPAIELKITHNSDVILNTAQVRELTKQLTTWLKKNSKAPAKGAEIICGTI